MEIRLIRYEMIFLIVVIFCRRKKVFEYIENILVDIFVPNKKVD